MVFRGRNSAGLQTLFQGDGVDLVEVIHEHDLVMTDLGQARLDQHDTSPIFGGSPALNQNGDIAFGAGLTPPTIPRGCGAVTLRWWHRADAAQPPSQLWDPWRGPE